MKGGCFGKILSFVFGIIIGIVLLAGTVAGVVYYAVTQVTINDVEKVANTKFEFIDDKAKIRDKTVIDIIDAVTGGTYRELSLEKIHEEFGIDVLQALEDTLDLTLREEGKEDLLKMPLADLFQGDNPKKLLNCFGLRDILAKAGVEMENLEKTPLVAEHLDDPMMDGFNGMLDELNLDERTIGQIQYLLGVSFGGGVLDNFRDSRLSEMADAINGVSVEKLDPNFSRDTYIKIGDKTYISDGFVPVTMIEAYEPIPEGETVPAENRYSRNEDKGIVSKDEEGGYRLKPEYAGLDPYEDFFAKDGGTGTFSARRHGFYVPAAGGDFVKAEDRFGPASEGGGFEKNRTGQYYEKFTPSLSGTHQRSYVRNFVKDGESYALETRGMVSVSDYVTDEDAGSFFEIRTEPDAEGKPFLAETAKKDGAFCLRKGTSARILQTLADMTLDTFDDEIKNIKIKEIMNIESAYVVKESDTGKYVTLKQDHEYKGTYLPGHTVAAPEEELWLVRHKDGLPSEYFNTQRYDVVTEGDSGFMVRLGEKTVKDLENGIDDVVKETRLGEVIDIDGDVFVLTEYKNHAEVQAADPDNVLDYYVFTDEKKDLLRTIADTDTAPVYRKIYDGNGNAVIKRMYDLKIDDIGGDRIDGIIDDTRLGEIMTIDDDSPRILKKLENSSIKNMSEDIKGVQLKDIMEIEADNVVAGDPSGDYVALKKGSPGDPYKYVGSYITGHTADDPDTELLLVRWHDGIVEDDYHTGDRYKITTPADSGLMVTLGEKTVGGEDGLEHGLQADVDGTALGDVIDIDGDVFVLTDYKNISDIPASEDVLDYYVYTAEQDMLRTIGSEDAEDTDVYRKIHDGKGNAVIKKMFGLKIGDIGGERMNDIVNETRIGEVLADEIREYYEIVENNTDGVYIALPALEAGEEYEGTYKTGRIAGGTENILFVKYQDGNMGPGTDFAGCKRYDIAQDADGNALEQSSGTLIGLKNKKIGDLGKSESGMQKVVDESLMSDVIDIDGNVYKKIAASGYAAANGELGDGNVYYKDEHGLYLNAEGVPEAERASLPGPFYKLVYEGKSNALLRKFAVLKVSDLGNSDAIDKAVKDCRLSDFITGEEGTFLHELQDSRIGNIEKDAAEQLENATMGELNGWSNLGLSAADLDKEVTIGTDTKKVKDWDIKTFIKHAITAVTTLSAPSTP